MAPFSNSIRYLLPLGLLTIAACGPPEEGADEAEVSEEQSADAAESAPQPEPMLMADTGWLSVGSDGSVLTTFLDTGGRYRDFRNGIASDSGDWEQRPDGSVCFAPDAGLGGCWTPDAPDKDGSMIVTNAEGKRVEIKRITYTAAPIEEDMEESS